MRKLFKTLMNKPEYIYIGSWISSFTLLGGHQGYLLSKPYYWYYSKDTYSKADLCGEYFGQGLSILGGSLLGFAFGGITVFIPSYVILGYTYKDVLFKHN
jgi:hypothetical protein